MAVKRLCIQRGQSQLDVWKPQALSLRILFHHRSRVCWFDLVRKLNKILQPGQKFREPGAGVHERAQLACGTEHVSVGLANYPELLISIVPYERDLLSNVITICLKLSRHIQDANADYCEQLKKAQNIRYRYTQLPQSQRSAKDMSFSTPLQKRCSPWKRCPPWSQHPLPSPFLATR